MAKVWLWGAFLLTAAAELSSLFYLRYEYRAVLAEGSEYTTPVAVDFRKNFYDNAYLTLHIPVNKAAWRGREKPNPGDPVYLALRKGAKDRLEILHAQFDKPAGDYIEIRAGRMDGSTLWFEFPADRLYMDADARQKIPVSELAERMTVENPDTGKVETRMKNEITARLRVKDGKAAIETLLVNGNPLDMTYATGGTGSSKCAAHCL